MSLSNVQDPGTNISTSPLAPASDFLKKGLSGKYILVFTCPNVNVPNTQRYANNATQLNRKW